jgi:hypothetical protein
MRRKLYRGRALFTLFIILTLPIYSSLVFADLTVIRNEGRSHVPNFINAGGDDWILEVNAKAGQSISPSQLTVNNFQFDTCATGAGGIHNCQYRFDYTDTTIFETVYPLEIKLKTSGKTETLNAKVTADGSPPSLTGLQASQSGDSLLVSLTVQEHPAACSGLKSIEFFNAANDAMLKSLKGTELESKLTSPCGLSPINEILTLTGTDEPLSVRIVATDKLNHSRSAVTNSFLFDRISPNILEGTFKVGDFHNFAPATLVSAPLSVDVEEFGSFLTASATSTKLSLNNEIASCVKTDIQNNIFTCTWPERQISVGESVSIVITANDGNNDQTKTVSVNLVVDSIPPVVTSFGTLQKLGSKNIARRINNTFEAKFQESQSGLRAENIIADFSGVNPALGNRKADSCTGERCVWHSIDVLNSGAVRLTKAADNVGNNAPSLPSADVELDVSAPEIGEVVVTALAGQDSEPRDFFQSRDILRVVFEVVDAAKINAKADLSDIVSGAEVVPVSCTPKENGHTCTFSTDRIKSGYDPDAQIIIIAEDAAGNTAKKTVSIEILGTDEETNPDFWSADKPACSPDGIDIKTTKLASQRVFCSLPLKTSVPELTLLSTQLANCEGDTEKLAQTFALNNFQGSTNPYIVFEFNPFEEDIRELKYSCTLRLFSRRGNEVIQNPEEEHIEVSIPFFVTKFDNELSTIEDEIDNAKESASSGFYGLIGILKEIAFWMQSICKVLGFLNVLRGALDIFNGNAEALRGSIFTLPKATYICNTAEGVKNNYVFFGIKQLQPFCEVVSCEKSICPWTDSYKRIEQTFLFGGQFERGRELLGNQGVSLNPSPYSNIVSAIGSCCIPAVIHNLDKLRQIECRYAYCLEEEVQEGVASIESCRELQDYQQCKYFWGQAFQLIPFVGPLNMLLDIIKNALSDPIGVFTLAITLTCRLTFCQNSNVLTTVCSKAGYVKWALDIGQKIGNLISTFKNIRAGPGGGTDYCEQVL